MDVFTELNEQLDQARKEDASSWPLAGELTSSKVSVKVDSQIAALIADGAHFLGMKKKDLVAEAVTIYLNTRREELRVRMHEAISRLDSSETWPQDTTER